MTNIPNDPRRGIYQGSPYASSASQQPPRYTAAQQQQQQTAGRRSGAIIVVAVVVILSLLSAVAEESGFAFFFIPLIIIFGVTALIAFKIIKNVRAQQNSKTSDFAAPHMCDDNQHTDKSLASSQDGYKSYTPPAYVPTTRHDYVFKKIRRLTAEEYRKKLEELDSLLKAGMLSQDEYNAKRREYSEAR